MTRIQLQEGVWLVRILDVGSTMDDTIHSPTGGVADRNERRRHSRFSPEGLISPYAVLGAMASSGNWSGGGEHSHLVFSRRREGEARARGGSSLPCSAPFDDDGASVHFRPKGGAGWNHGARVVLLDPKVELGWLGFALATPAATKMSGGIFLGASRGSPRRGFYQTNTRRDTQGLYQEFYLQFTISVKIFSKGYESWSVLI
jgi:hypothetical protein